MVKEKVMPYSKGKKKPYTKAAKAAVVKKKPIKKK
jgi:hypothetical protein